MNAKKRKRHRFILIVETSSARRSAELDVLSAFAQRQPDDCKFYLRKTKPKS
jgi:hypothetical protein